MKGAPSGFVPTLRLTEPSSFIEFALAMVSAGYYRNEAARCRRLAQESEDPEAAARGRALARDYTALADALETDEAPPLPPTVHVPMQQQPVRQQQAKAEPEEDG